MLEIFILYGRLKDDTFALSKGHQDIGYYTTEQKAIDAQVKKLAESIADGAELDPDGFYVTRVDVE